MIIRWLVGSTLCALVLMVWGALFWVSSVRSADTLRALPDEPRLQALLQETLPKSGGYVFPPPWTDAGLLNPRGIENLRQKSLQGPTGILLIHRDGMDPLSLPNLWMNFLIFFLASLTASLFLITTNLHLGTIIQRWIFLLGLGLFSALVVRMGDATWLRLPWNYVLLTSLYTLSQWAVGGIVLAFLIRPRGEFRVSDQRLPLWKRARDF